MKRPDAYIICTSPRSGSTLLCKLLAATGIAGVPNSHFHKPGLQDWLKAFALEASSFSTETEALRAVFAAAIARGTGSTGMFGLRLQQHSFAFFRKQLHRLHPGHKTDHAALIAGFGDIRYIHLSRADKLEQAISCVKANQTGLWHRNADGTELERTAPPKEPRYDRAEITRYIIEFERADAAWQAWFKLEGVTPLPLFYSDLAKDPAATLRKALQFLGANPRVASTIEPSVAKLADATSNAWAARYLRESQD